MTTLKLPRCMARKRAVVVEVRIVRCAESNPSTDYAGLRVAITIPGWCKSVPTGVGWYTKYHAAGALEIAVALWYLFCDSTEASLEMIDRSILGFSSLNSRDHATKALAKVLARKQQARLVLSIVDFLSYDTHQGSTSCEQTLRVCH